jgi:hypothetical protein
MDKPKCPSARRLREILAHYEENTPEFIEEMAELGITDEINSLTKDALFDEVAEQEPEIERLRR